MRKKLTIKENQEEALKILVRIAEICSKLRLRYYLAYGTLLGAVRHKGFIPWDDDVDIMMPRDDYKKLIDYFMKNAEALKPLELFCPSNNKNYPFYIARISNNEFELEVDNEEPYGMGTFIDIYPLDGVGNDKKGAVKLRRKGKRLSSYCFLATRNRFEKGTTSSKFRLLVKLPAYIYAKIRGKEHFLRELEKLSKKCNYNNSNFVSCVTWGGAGNEKDILPEEWFGEGISLPFEDYSFLVPVKYREILTFFYGDYMQLPPESERIGHHFYRTYRKNDKE